MRSKQISNKDSSYCYETKLREILLQKLIIMQVNDLQQMIINHSNKPRTPFQALCHAYDLLCEEQKIAFLLAGGVEQLLYYQEQEKQLEREKRDKTGQSSSNPRTDDLPVLC